MFVVWVGEVSFFLLAINLCAYIYIYICEFMFIGNCVGTAGDDLLDLLDQAVA